MIGELFRSLGLGAAEDTRQDTETVAQIASGLHGVPAERARFLAAFAYLLGRVAFADHDVSPEERQSMESFLAGQGVSSGQAGEVVNLAVRATGSHGAAEDYQIAREFEAIATREEKLQLLRALFTVSAEHGITTLEDNEISRIARVLRLERADVSALRIEFRDALNSRQPSTPRTGQV